MATTPTQPSLQKHHGGYTWTSYWRDDSKKLRTKRFGKQGEMTARQARRNFSFWLDTEWKAKDRVRNPEGTAATYTVTRLAAQYLLHARKVFRKNGKPTSHIWQVKYAMRSLRDFLGAMPAEAAGSPDIAGVRDGMIMDEEGKPRSAKTINGRLLIIKQAFKWAREKGRVPSAVALDIAEVARLNPARSEAKGSKRIPPIALDIVWETCRHTSPTVRAMIEATYYSGARPGEICIMRGCDIETVSDDCWVYTPHSHKMQHKAKQKVKTIMLGPKAIAAIKPYLTTNTRAYLFSPAIAMQERRGVRPEKMAACIGRVYTEQGFRKAIHHACRAAGIDLWNPHQLRHAHATEVRRVFGAVDAGLEAAKESLGHGDSRTTEIYADPSLERAMAIARKVG